MATACRSVLMHADERQVADVKSRGPGIPMLMPSSRVMMILPTTVAKEPGAPRRARYKRENHRAGKAGLIRLNLWFSPRAFFCTGATGASRHPAFPAPS